MEDLEAILGQVDYICSMNPECVGDPTTESYWSAKKAKLRPDFAELGDISGPVDRKHREGQG